MSAMTRRQDTPPTDERTELRISEFQARVLEYAGTHPDHNLVLDGGRGSSKTRTLLLLALAHCATYLEHARVLITRSTQTELAQIETDLVLLLGQLYGPRARGMLNRHEHTVRIEGGAAGMIQLLPLDRPEDYTRAQGHSFSMIGFDEAGNYDGLALMMLVRSSLRAPDHVHTRLVITANPGGRNHAALKARYIDPAPRGDGDTFQEADTGLTFARFRSTLSDNPFLPTSYLKQLKAQAAVNPALARAWIHGDWDAMHLGGFFAGLFERGRNVIPDWPFMSLDRFPLRVTIGADHGTAAPAAFLVIAEALDPFVCPLGWRHVRGDVIVLDELVTSDPDDDAKGMGYGIDDLCEMVHSMCRAWNIPPRGVMDAAAFADQGMQSIAAVYKQHPFPVYFTPSAKTPIEHRWAPLKTLMANARRPHERERPGLYVCSRCEYLTRTIMTIGADPRMPERHDPRGNDHAIDALYYGTARRRSALKVTPNFIG